jgi:hypothetical protein
VRPAWHFVGIPALVASLVAVLPATPSLASVVYSIDDGTPDFTSGLTPAGGSVIFANGFTAVPGGERINSLSIQYGLRGTAGTARPGTPVELLIFRDRNGAATPNYPVLLRSAPTTVTSPGTNTFIQVPIDPVDVAGNFFVGVLVSRLPSDGPYPISFDRTRPSGRSYGAFFTGPITHDRLSAMTYNASRTTASSGNLNSNAFVRAADGNFLLRAAGVPIPEPAGPQVAAAVLSMMGLRRPRRRAAVSCRTEGASSAFNGQG